MFPGEFVDDFMNDIRMKNPLSEKPCPLCDGMMGWPEDEVVLLTTGAMSASVRQIG